MADRSNWWALGVVPLAVLWLLGSAGNQVDVERDVAKNVRDAVGDDLDGLDLKVTGRDVRLRGNAFTNAGLQTAIANPNVAIRYSLFVSACEAVGLVPHIYEGGPQLIAPAGQQS